MSASPSIDRLVADLRAFSARKEVVKALRKRMREPVPAVRRSIQQRALSTLPRRGGLNTWAAKTRVTARISVGGSGVTVRLRGNRKSARGMSDVKRLDAGRVRHPSWGRRGPNQWHMQRVRAGYFTEPSVELEQWRAAALVAVDEALEVIARG